MRSARVIMILLEGRGDQRGDGRRWYGNCLATCRLELQLLSLSLNLRNLSLLLQKRHTCAYLFVLIRLGILGKIFDVIHEHPGRRLRIFVSAVQKCLPLRMLGSKRHDLLPHCLFTSFEHCSHRVELLFCISKSASELVNYLLIMTTDTRRRPGDGRSGARD